MYRKHATILILILALVALTVLATPVFAADADIIISEVMQDTRTGTSGEWVEIYNKGATPVIMNGWEICDTAACDTIPNITINSGEYFLIATSQVGLEAEFNDANYTLPLDTYNPALTTFVGTIGNTLGNNDMVFLVSSSTEVTDCVSWGTGPSCNLTPGGASPFAGTAYASGSNGADGAPGGSATGQGQSIVNVGSTWGVSVLDDPSPYGINTIDGGPTAVKLNEITVSDSSPLVIVSLAGVFLMIISGWLVARRKATA